MEEEVVGETSQPREKQQRNVNDEDVSLVTKTAQALVVAMRMIKKNYEKDYDIERLIALGTKTFTGTANSTDAKEWIDQLEKCFDVMECLEDRKVELATFLLRGGADDWWRFIRNRRPDHEAIGWRDFKKAFCDEYYPRSYRAAKQNKVLRLVQGSMTVAEYRKKYIELTKYDATMIEDETDKCKNFVDGLREEIRSFTTAMEWKEFEKLVGAAMRVEMSILQKKIREEQSENVHSHKQFKGGNRIFVPRVACCGNFKPRYRGQSSFRTNPNTTQQLTGSSTRFARPAVNQFTWQQGESASSHNRYLQCQNCGKVHQGQCMKGTNVCYNCGQPGHMRRDCPLWL